ncbi:class I SAM-dependent methyltransferase [Pseudonocardiaceae bacterium YIM PH 21723]|nr:class I SAM-dependent methyltransferase [Pseudonocardiaceae bacterium YIM PH 21723]
MTTDNWLADTRASYDADADGYTDKVRDLLTRMPYLRTALGVFADQVLTAGGGSVADVGCGPGHVTSHLHKLGVDAFGIDLSPEMVGIAKRDHPGLHFEVGSMTDLKLPDTSLAGLLAWWSLIHIPDEEVPGVLAGFHRVVRPGGPVQIGFHVGDSTKVFGQLRSHRRTPERVATWLREAGFAIEAELLVNPDGDRPGAILFARRLP